MGRSWTYEEYWSRVVGPDRSAADAIREFKLSACDEAAIGEWLCLAEDAVWDECEGDGELPVEWDEHHRRALRALVEAR